ncbi:MAG: lysophospholipid acyltransferase family protein [Alphaproteobacteria bacterium]
MSPLGWAKRITASDRVRPALCWFAAQYIRFVFALSRWRVVRGEIPDAYWDRGESFILALWHGRFLMLPYCWRRGAPVNMLISQHRDGELIAKTIRHFGLGSLRGSTRRGGSAALRAMVKALKQGTYVGITPDGPRGPRMRANLGAVSVARLSGAPIVPVTYSVSRRRVLNSWDRFVLAWPFSSGVFVWGQPIEVSREADEAALEAARSELEAELNAITREADGLMGQAAIEPAEPAPVRSDELLSLQDR